ncbi:acid phosphatase [Rhodotorula toruloides]|uniref:Acid phosphatase n=1 Tax=Rhodotorula toruloides TaxID=5286 RepID=A0A511KI55_RHOTO|nr:acid phosphatase [Rhodotorula toruloides]
MSYPGQAHHPHSPGNPPLAHLIHRSHPVDEQHPYVPSGLMLVQAHWFVRHGERAPVRQRLVGVGDVPAVFSLCSVGREFRTAVLSFTPPLSPSALAGEPPSPAILPTEATTGKDTAAGAMDVRRLTEDVGSSARGTKGGPSDCYWGELTDLGRRSTLELGARLRSLYVDQLDFLPPTFTSSNSSVASFRSTNMPRTIESLHQIVEGLWGKEKREEGAKVEYLIRGWQDEDLYPNASCNPLRIDSSPRASGVLDTVLVCRAHGVELPAELEDPKTLRILEGAICHEWFDGYKNPEFRKLAMGRLLSSLRQTLEAKANDPLEKVERTRLAVYSCHDTSIAGILNALDAFDNRWPPFTSHVAVEFFRSASPPSVLSSFLPSFLRPSQPHYVRLRFNARNLRLPACAPEGKHLAGSEGEVCTFEAFKDAVRDVEVSMKEWRGLCGNKVE